MKTLDCGTTSIAFWNKETKQVVWTRPTCGCWRCPKCSEKRLKPAWTRHLTAIIETLPVVYRVRTQGKASFEAFVQTVRRKGGKYARIHTLVNGVDCYDVYSTVPLAGAERMTPQDGIAVLTRAIKAIPVDVRTVQPVSTSRAWKRPVRAKRGFERLLPNHIVPKRAFEKAAEEFGAQISEWTPKDFSGVIEGLRISVVGWESQKYDAFLEYLECLSLPIANKAVSYRGRKRGEAYKAKTANSAVSLTVP